MRKPPKLKAFRASKEARRRARLLVGQPPPSRRQEAGQRRPPKHVKQEMERAFDA